MILSGSLLDGSDILSNLPAIAPFDATLFKADYWQRVIECEVNAVQNLGRFLARRTVTVQRLLIDFPNETFHPTALPKAIPLQVTGPANCASFVAHDQMLRIFRSSFQFHKQPNFAIKFLAAQTFSNTGAQPTQLLPPRNHSSSTVCNLSLRRCLQGLAYNTLA